MIHVSNLSKSFGEVKAVDDLTFSVSAGEVFGLLGPNGAGKTTTLRILATLLQADSGSVTVNGHDVKRDAERVRAEVGVVNNGMGLYDRLTGLEVLRYFGGLYGMSRAQIDVRVDVLDDLLDLGSTLTRRTGDFSTGMKQKIVIARSVLHDPSVIFFDEATSGLDVMARRTVLNFVKRYKDEQRAVIYSTHVMSEVEVCDRVAIIYGGELIAQGSVDELIAKADAKDLEAAFFTLIERSDIRAQEEVSA